MWNAYLKIPQNWVDYWTSKQKEAGSACRKTHNAMYVYCTHQLWKTHHSTQLTPISKDLFFSYWPATTYHLIDCYENAWDVCMINRLSILPSHSLLAFVFSLHDLCAQDTNNHLNFLCIINCPFKLLVIWVTNVIALQWNPSTQINF